MFKVVSEMEILEKKLDDWILFVQDIQVLNIFFLEYRARLCFCPYLSKRNTQSPRLTFLDCEIERKIKSSIRCKIAQIYI